MAVPSAESVPQPPMLPVKLLRAGLGDDLDAAVADAIVFGGERVLIHADFEDVGFGRNLAAFKAVNINLAAVGPGGRTGECLQLVLQFGRVVGEHIDGTAFDDRGAGVLLGAEADGLRLALNLDLLFFDGDGERQIERFRLARGETDIRNGEWSEAGCADGNGVRAGRESSDGILAVGTGLDLEGRDAAGERDGSAGDYRAAGVSDLAVERGGLREGGSRQKQGSRNQAQYGKAQKGIHVHLWEENGQDDERDVRDR